MQRKLARIGRLRLVNLGCFYGAFLAVVSGLTLSLGGFDRPGIFVAILGAVLFMVLLAESYLVLPFLKCPRCGNPFFVPCGWLAILYRINPHWRSCIHCGLSIHDPGRATGA